MQYLITFLILFYTSISYSLEPVEVGDLSAGYALDDHVEYVVDDLGQLDQDQLLTNQDWLTHNKETLSFGYTSDVYWLRFQVTNQSSDDVSRLLEIAYPVLDDIKIYVYDESNHLIDTHLLGDKIPFSERLINHRNFLIPIEVSANKTQTWLMRVETSSAVQVPMIIWPERDFFVQDQTKIMGMGIYYGIMLIMALYNLVMYFSVREKSYLYYVFYVASMALFLASLQGLTFQYVWPMATNWNDGAIIVMLSGVLCFASLFSIDFLALGKDHRFLTSLFRSGVFLAVCLVIAVNFVPYYILIKTLIFLACLIIGVSIYTSIFRWAQGYSPAKLFTVAWSSVLLGGVILALNKFNVIPRNFFTENAVQVGSAIEVILLSFALAERLTQEKRERYDAQFQALSHERAARLAQSEALQFERQTREAQDRTLEIQRRANETLEEHVKERTSELELANKKLAELSTTDGLTGVRNRRWFDEVLEREYNRARREKEYLCILMLDIDYFKNVNDTYGHQVGDEALRIVAGVLKNEVHRTTDVIARYGGEEFAVILSNTELSGASLVAERIRKSIEEQAITVDDIAFSITVSIGVMGDVPSNNETDGANLWLKEADSALYMAKEKGRNRVVLSPSCSSKRV